VRDAGNRATLALMTTAFVLNWWAISLRGGAAVLFGLFALLRPGGVLGALVFVFGVYALFDGVFAVIAGIRAAEHHERWWPARGRRRRMDQPASSFWSVPAASLRRLFTPPGSPIEGYGLPSNPGSPVRPARRGDRGATPCERTRPTM
jgi:hypothetical protein